MSAHDLPSLLGERNPVLVACLLGLGPKPNPSEGQLVELEIAPAEPKDRADSLSRGLGKRKRARKAPVHIPRHLHELKVAVIRLDRTFGVLLGGQLHAPERVRRQERLAHFYHPTWWGIYVLFEGWVHLARRLYDLGGRTFSPMEASRAAREALFRHELFHHGTEAFATRLEVAYRKPLYRIGIRDLYDRTFGTDDCTEEALANGCAIVKPVVSRSARDAITEFVRRSPPGYRCGVRYATSGKLNRGLDEFAEELIRSTLPSARPLGGSVWSALSYSFTGRIRNTSQVIYLLPRRSPLCARLPMKRIAPMTVRKLKKGLKRLGKCEFDHQGGRHEVWRTPSGSKFEIPRHTGDLATGTLRTILEQAGISMPISKFQEMV